MFRRRGDLLEYNDQSEFLGQVAGEFHFFQEGVAYYLHLEKLQPHHRAHTLLTLQFLVRLHYHHFGETRAQTLHQGLAISHLWILGEKQPYSNAKVPYLTICTSVFTSVYTSTSPL